MPPHTIQSHSLVLVIRCPCFRNLYLYRYMIPLCSVTSFAILAVEEVAMHIEQPFGTEEDDLPLDAYCLTIEADLLALIDEHVDESIA